MSDDTPSFDTEEDAKQWMIEQVDDPCVDNERFAYADREEELDMFWAQDREGCCGSFYAEVLVCGRLAYIGCNYGH